MAHGWKHSVLGAVSTAAVWLTGSGCSAVQAAPSPDEELAARRVTAVRQHSGRVGDVWFNAAKVDGPVVLTHRENGLWKGPWGELSTTGNRVTGTWAGLPADFTVEHDGSATTIQGVWARRPVYIRYTPQALSMHWGWRGRELVQEPRYESSPGCFRYVRNDGGLTLIDDLELCGLALRAEPPPAQLVAAMLATGFERARTPGLELVVLPSWDKRQNN